MTVDNSTSGTSTPPLMDSEEVSEEVAALLLLSKDKTKKSKVPGSREKILLQSCKSLIDGIKAVIEHPSAPSSSLTVDAESKKVDKIVKLVKNKTDNDIISDYDFLKSQEITSGMLSKPIDTKKDKISKKRGKKRKGKDIENLVKDSEDIQYQSGTKRKRKLSSLSLEINTSNTRRSNMLQNQDFCQDSLYLNERRIRNKTLPSQQSGRSELEQAKAIMQRSKEVAMSSLQSNILRRAIRAQKKKIMDETLKASTNEIMNEALKVYNVAIQSDKEKQLQELALKEEEFLISARAAFRKSYLNPLLDVSMSRTYDLGREYNECSDHYRLFGMKEENRQQVFSPFELNSTSEKGLFDAAHDYNTLKSRALINTRSFYLY